MSMLLVILWIVLLGTMLFGVCRVTGQESPQQPAATDPTLTQPVVQASSQFALDLYHQLAQNHKGRNLFFSPYSLFNALLMAAEGARDETARQMETVLHCLAAGREGEASPRFPLGNL